MPVLFVGHGSPMNAIEENRFTDGWRDITQSIPAPKGILCISAHWYEGGKAVSSTVEPSTIHDFYGFPPELYKIEYPAAGAPELARRVANLSNPFLRIDDNRGLDHGTWSVLRFMYPKADVPVCQMQVNASYTPQESYRAGQRLRALREEGYLILGSGNIVHNLSLVDWDNEGGYSWADEFDAYIKNSVLDGVHDSVISYQDAGSSALKAVRYRDHFDPLLYVLGASDPTEPIKVFNEERVMGALSMTSYLIGI